MDPLGGLRKNIPITREKDPGASCSFRSLHLARPLGHLIFSLMAVRGATTWVVVTIIIPFWTPTIIRHQISGTIIFDNHPYMNILEGF